MTTSSLAFLRLGCLLLLLLLRRRWRLLVLLAERRLGIEAGRHEAHGEAAEGLRARVECAATSSVYVEALFYRR